MKKLYAIILSIGIIGMSSCDYLAKDISEDMNFTVNGDLFKNTVQIEVVDAATGQAIPSLKGIYIEGPNSDVIYSQTGKKNPEYTNGIISLGVDPKYLFNNDNPVEFNVAINADGYIPYVQRIVIYPEEFNLQIRIEMLNYSVGSPSMEIKVKDITLNNGKVINDELIKKVGSGPDTLYYDDGFTTIGIPTGAEFHFWLDRNTGEILSGVNTWNEEVIKFQKNGKDVFSNLGTFIDTNILGSRLEKVNFIGSKIRAVIYYPKEELLPFQFEPNIEFDFTGKIRDRKIGNIYYSKTLNQSEILKTTFYHAVEKPILKVDFYTELSNGKEIQVYPIGNSVYYSLRLKPNTISPVTNQAIKEGDLIEIQDRIFVFGPHNFQVENVPIRKDKFGNLRAQANSPHIGYYMNDIYTKFINFDIYGFPSLNIPDPENLSYECFLVIDDLKINFNAYPRGVSNTSYILHKLKSKSPISEAYLEISFKYFGKEILSNQRISEIFDPIDIIDFSGLNQISNYDLSLICRRGTVVKPSIFAKVFIPSENAYYYANIKNGKWATRGIEVGTELKLDFTYDNIKVDTTITIKSDNFINKNVAGSQFCQ